MLGGVGGLAISMGVCGAAGLLFLGWLIRLQVYCGGVGTRPGCPRPCRCGCPAARKDRAHKVSAELEAVESSMVNV